MRLDTLFVVIDPTRDTQPALARAAALARKHRSRIHLFLCVYEPLDAMNTASSRRTGKHAVLETAETRLKALAAPLTEAGLSVTREACWNEKWYRSVSRAAANRDADLIIKSTFVHSRTRRLLHSTSDWTIMRHGPCPVLLVREHSAPPGKCVLACMDLEATDDGHRRLNNAIARHARGAARALDRPWHLLHAASPHPDYTPALRDQNTPADTAREALAQSFELNEAQVHLVPGNARDVIPAQAETLNAELVVIGTVGRDGLTGTLIGNTVEKVLDQLSCDVLCVS